MKQTRGPEENSNQLENLAMKIASHFQNHILLTDVIESQKTKKALINFSENTDADLLVLFTHRREMMEQAFDPGISKELIERCEIPVMTIPYQKKPVYFL